jgi:hypothetical protein
MLSGRPGALVDAIEGVSMTTPLRIVLLALALSASLMLLACSGQTSGSAERVARQAAAKAAPELTSDGLELVRSTARSRLWVKPDHHIGRYDNILVTGIGFSYGSGQESLNDAQEQQVGEMLKTAISGITSDSPVVGQAQEEGPCVVALQLGLKDIFLHISETTGSSVSYVSSFGSATMIVEFRDSLTDVPLVRYAANRGLGGGPGTGQLGANLNRLGRALGEMVRDMTKELQTIVPDTTVRAETECNDGIYKMTGRG